MRSASQPKLLRDLYEMDVALRQTWRQLRRSCWINQADLTFSFDADAISGFWHPAAQGASCRPSAVQSVVAGSNVTVDNITRPAQPAGCFGLSNPHGRLSSNTSSSVDGEVALFSGTGGETGEARDWQRHCHADFGVLGTATSGSDYAPATSGSGDPKGQCVLGGFSSATAAARIITIQAARDVAIAD